MGTLPSPLGRLLMLCAMKSERACGLDHWAPHNWLNLPIEARKGIASILIECETGLVWPHQVMQNAVALLGKSATDDRPISLTSLLYAVYVKIKELVIADFDRAHATWWDSAVAGNSCLREGIRRRLVSGAACLNGKHCVDTFFETLRSFMTPLTTRNSCSKRASSNGIPSFCICPFWCTQHRAC